MTILTVTGRLFIEIRRNPFTFAILLAMPLLIMIAFWVAFGAVTDTTNTTKDIYVIDQDNGIPDHLKAYFESYVNNSDESSDTSIIENALEHGFASSLIEIMQRTNYTGDDNIPIFDISLSNDETTAQNLLENREIAALIIFPEEFSNSTISAHINAISTLNDAINITEMSTTWPTNTNATVVIKGDNSYQEYQITKLIIQSFIEEFTASQSNLNFPAEISSELLRITLQEYSVFEQMIPGIILIGLISQAGVISGILATEFMSPNKTITRVHLSHIKPWEYLVGTSIIQFCITPIQLAILYIVASILGFEPSGDLVQSFIVIMLVVFFSLSLSFLSAAIFSTPESAGSSTGFFVMPICFATGSLLSIPDICLIPQIFPTASGMTRDFLLWDFIPATHIVNAVRSVLLYNFSIFDVWADIVAFIILEVPILIGCILFFSNRRFRGSN